jgi:opacity protein-like surface antigen
MIRNTKLRRILALSVLITCIASALPIYAAATAVAADLGSSRTVNAYEDTIQKIKWSGFSVSIFTGWGTSTSELSAAYNSVDIASIDGVGNDGALLGGELAYDFAVTNRIIAGPLVGCDWSDIKTTASVLNNKLSYDRGTSCYTGARLGLSLGDKSDWLIYAKGLYAWNSPGKLNLGTESLDLADRSGWGIGGGTEIAFGSHLFGFADYTHIMYDKECVYCKTIEGDSLNISEKTDDNLFKVGLKYRIN